MGKFDFRYKTIQNVKEKIKKHTEKEYSLILKEIENRKQEIEDIKKEISSTYETSEKLSSKMIHFLNSYRNNLKSKIQTLEEEIEELKEQKENKRKEVAQKHMEFEVFNKLEEKKLEEYTEEEAKRENKFIDDLAIQKFCRGNK